MTASDCAVSRNVCARSTCEHYIYHTLQAQGSSHSLCRQLPLQPIERLKHECLEVWPLVDNYSRYSEKNVAVDDEDPAQVSTQSSSLTASTI